MKECSVHPKNCIEDNLIHRDRSGDCTSNSVVARWVIPLGGSLGGFIAWESRRPTLKRTLIPKWSLKKIFFLSFLKSNRHNKRVFGYKVWNSFYLYSRNMPGVNQCFQACPLEGYIEYFADFKCVGT